MSDEAWRAHERRWRQEPSDQDALGRAIAGMRRSGLVVPPDLLDARVEPATVLETTLPLEVWAVLPGEREPTTVGWGPGRVEVPSHRYWGVGDVPAGIEGLGALGDELRGHAIPGLRLTQLAPSWQRPEEEPRLDRHALAALGPQPQLRWLELPRWGQITPGEVVRALGCTSLEVFRAASLVGLDPEPSGTRLAGLEALPRLREVQLAGCYLEADDLRAMECLKELETLEVSGEGSVGFADLVRLDSAGRLRRVRVETTDATDLAHAASLGQLQAVWVDWFQLDGCVEQILAIRGLRELTMGGPRSDMLRPSDATFRRLAERPLTRLAMHAHILSASALESLGRICTLVALSGNSLYLGARGSELLALGGCAGLEELQVNLMQGGPADLSPFPRLRRLGLSAHLDAGFSPALDGLRHLEAVSIRAAGNGALTLTSPGLRTLALHGSSLEGTTLDVRGARLRELQLPALGNVWSGPEETVERLGISTSLLAEDAERLGTFRALRTLQLAPARNIEELVDRVVRAARAAPALRRVMVGDAGSWDQAVRAQVHRAIRRGLGDVAPRVALVDDDLSLSSEPNA